MVKLDYIDHMGTDLTIVNSARVSFGKEKDILDEKDEKLIKYLAKHQHFTPFEHCVLSVKIACPLYIRSQIMRHRTFAYNEISRRYTSENLEMYQPEKYRLQSDSSKQCSDGEIDAKLNGEIMKEVAEFYLTAEDLYSKLISRGVARELARGILPQSTMTEFHMTGNLRNWVHFIKLREDSHAQEEVQIIAKAAKDLIIEKFPIGGKALFEV